MEVIYRAEVLVFLVPPEKGTPGAEISHGRGDPGDGGHIVLLEQTVYVSKVPSPRDFFIE